MRTYLPSLLVPLLTIGLAACGAGPQPVESEPRASSGRETTSRESDAEAADEPEVQTTQVEVPPEPVGEYQLAVSGAQATVTRPCAEGAECTEVVSLVRETDQCGLADLATGANPAPTTPTLRLMDVMRASLPNDAGFPALVCIYAGGGTEREAMVIHALRESPARIVFGLYHDGRHVTLVEGAGEAVGLHIREPSPPWRGPGRPPHPRRWSFEYDDGAYHGGGVDGPAIAEQLR